MNIFQSSNSQTLFKFHHCPNNVLPSKKIQLRATHGIYQSCVFNLLQITTVPPSVLVFHDFDSFEDNRPVILLNMLQLVCLIFSQVWSHVIHLGHHTTEVMLCSSWSLSGGTHFQSVPLLRICDYCCIFQVSLIERHSSTLN